MNAVTFDTLKFVETLENAKLPREQASAIAMAVRDAYVSVDVATKTDVEVLEAQTDSKFDMLRKDMDSGFTLLRKDMDAKFAQVDAKFALLRKDMDTMRKDIIIKQGAMMVTLAGLVLAGVKLL